MKAIYYSSIPIITNFCFEIGLVIVIIKKIHYKTLKTIISINSSLKENIISSYSIFIHIQFPLCPSLTVFKFIGWAVFFAWFLLMSFAYVLKTTTRNLGLCLKQHPGKSNYGLCYKPPIYNKVYSIYIYYGTCFLSIFCPFFFNQTVLCALPTNFFHLCIVLLPIFH